jgi:hypothetical protein
MDDPIVPTDGGLPVFSGPPPILLPAESAEETTALAAALQDPERGAALRAVAARWPASVETWARLGEWAYRERRDVEAFAYFRTGYHRGLDRLRQNGWRGLGYVPWAHEPNRGVLRAIRGLMLASAALGEAEEARRCRRLLLESDPSDPLGVGGLRDEDLESRPPLAEGS